MIQLLGGFVETVNPCVLAETGASSASSINLAVAGVIIILAALVLIALRRTRGGMGAAVVIGIFAAGALAALALPGTPAQASSSCPTPTSSISADPTAAPTDVATVTPSPTTEPTTTPPPTTGPTTEPTTTPSPPPSPEPVDGTLTLTVANLFTNPLLDDDAEFDAIATCTMTYDPVAPFYWTIVNDTTGLVVASLPVTSNDTYTWNGTGDTYSTRLHQTAAAIGTTPEPAIVPTSGHAALNCVPDDFFADNFGRSASIGVGSNDGLITDLHTRTLTAAAPINGWTLNGIVPIIDIGTPPTT